MNQMSSLENRKMLKLQLLVNRMNITDDHTGDFIPFHKLIGNPFKPITSDVPWKLFRKKNTTLTYNCVCYDGVKYSPHKGVVNFYTRVGEKLIKKWTEYI